MGFELNVIGTISRIESQAPRDAQFIILTKDYKIVFHGYYKIIRTYENGINKRVLMQKIDSRTWVRSDINDWSPRKASTAKFRMIID